MGFSIPYQTVWDFFWGDLRGGFGADGGRCCGFSARLVESDRKDRTMYSVVNKRTGQVLASHLTLDAVDTWIARNESKYAGIRVVGMTVFVADAI
jgi:hypothetical protein